MKRFSDKQMERIERKRRKIESFIGLISDKTTETKDNDSKDVFSNDFKQMSELRKKLSIRLSKEKPKIFVESEYLRNSSDEVPKCLDVEDIQHLILATLIPPPRLSCPPNWCKVFKPTKATKVCIFIIDFDLSPTQELFNENDFKYCVKFESKDDWINCLLNVKLSNRQLEKMHKKSKSMANFTEIGIPSEERVSRTELLLSLTQMSIEGYPMITDPNCSGFLRSKSKYCPVSDSSPIFSVDCEMCLTTERLEVTRISVVDENCSVIYDTLVKPKNRITNYLTKYSGITKKLLDPIDVTLEDVYKQLKQILPEDAILCGQSLNSDLQALQLIHPYIIDTSVIYNLSGHRSVKTSLKILSQKFLNISIQNNEISGHDSVEDAMAAMKLVKLKLGMGLHFGDRVLNRSVHLDDIDRQCLPLTDYLQRLDIELKVFYDFIDLNTSNKLVIICSQFDRRSTQLSDAINRVIHSDKEICLVVDKRGKCFIKY